MQIVIETLLIILTTIFEIIEINRNVLQQTIQLRT